MNPDAAQELLDLIMLEDFVDRRRALDVWSRRWLATMHVEHDGPVELARHTLLMEVIEGLLSDEAGVLSWGWRVDRPHTVQLELNCVRRTPADALEVP